MSGTRWVQDHIMRKHGGNIRVYAIWMPVLRSDNLTRVQAADLPDPRVRRYWDGEALAGLYHKRFSELSEFNDRIVWDYFAVYGRTAVWEDGTDGLDFGRPDPVELWGSTIIEFSQVLKLQMNTMMAEAWPNFYLPLAARDY